MTILNPVAWAAFARRDASEHFELMRPIDYSPQGADAHADQVRREKPEHEVVVRGLIPADTEPVDPEEEKCKAGRDLLAFGHAYIVAGRHVPNNQVTVLIGRNAFDATHAAPADAVAKFHQADEISARIEGMASLATGCHRSHPHEDMSPECQQKAVEAKLRNRIARLEGALLALLESVDEPPEPRCTCHLGAPPCSDCVEHAGTREVFSLVRAVLAEE